MKLRLLVWGEYADIRNFFQAQHQAQYLIDVLAQAGAATDDFQAILDFGCGAGRAIRQFPNLKKPLKKAKVCGTDINREQINWCRRNLLFAEFEVNQPYPPLTYSNEKFDFVYTFSVFTHLTESQQYVWINQLSRVLKPGGYLLITTCGESYFETLTENEKEQFREGRLVVRHGDLAGIPSTYAECIALAEGFDLIHFSPGVPSPTGPKGEMDHYFLRRSASIPK